MLIEKDVKRYLDFLPPNSSIIRKIHNILFSQGVWAIAIFRFGVWIYSIQSPFKILFLIIYVLLKKFVEIVTGIDIGTNANIGDGFYINHFGNIHINAKTKIGKNCFVNSGVTIGDSGKFRFADSPHIGDNVYIGTGAKIIGAVEIGNNVIIGANSVITKKIPDNSVVVGNPAKIINDNGDKRIHDFLKIRTE